VTKEKSKEEELLLEKLEEKPEDLNLRKQLLAFYLETKQVQKAVDELLNIAWIQERMGHPELALKCYQQIHLLDPTHMPLIWNAEKERKTKRPSSKIISIKNWKKEHQREEPSSEKKSPKKKSDSSSLDEESAQGKEEEDQPENL